MPLDDGLKRAFSHVFQDPDPFLQTFRSIFSEYSLEDLEKATTEEAMRIGAEISQRADVQEMREHLNLELACGQEYLDGVIGAIALNDLGKAGIVPKGKLGREEIAQFDEVWLYRQKDTEKEKVAMALFREQTPLEDRLFTPNTVFYSNGGVNWVRNSEGEHQIDLDGQLYTRAASRITVVRDNIVDEQAKSQVNDVINLAIQRYNDNGIKVQIPPSRLRNHILTSLGSFFPDTYNGSRFDYNKIHSIFRRIRRKNIDPHSYIKDASLAAKLEQSIDEVIAAPYAVIRTRAKQGDRAFEKVMESMYDIESNEGTQGGSRKFRDMYGIRVVLPTVKEIYAFADKIGQTTGIEIIDTKDYIKEPKTNMSDPTKVGYQSLHLILGYAGMQFEMQVRTHEMDRLAESGYGVSHGETFLRQKREKIDQIPFGVRYVVGTALGLCEPVAPPK